MSAAKRRVSRTYTAARRHPWVLGRVGDWKIPLGPYTPPQLAVAFVGAVLLIKTFSWWSWLGPVPVAAWAVAVWMARRARIGGRSPWAAVAGVIGVLFQPPAGRIGGRPARDRRPQMLLGAFTVERAVVGAVAGAVPPVPPAPVVRRSATRAPSAEPEHRRGLRSLGRRRASLRRDREHLAPVPQTALQQLLGAGTSIESEGREK
ncbi:hypothetical protein HUT19_41060 [Streptomyces sp. NA02950]|uniref:hypothetical protein n=1 Tax=Streptomyces sp. NA02950 TaxID=2742137 RepID=UPI0015913E22|nr:hypothetical protein [Streptomyces sp. NA02950]QKV90394.1 hypothetical protein HUT19_00160 [Streptomyces sp. NA02950]QKV97273.1 hypothetical protein HUT19_41060 [Streptomyces sp. NA02950]